MSKEETDCIAIYEDRTAACLIVKVLVESEKKCFIFKVFL